MATLASGNGIKTTERCIIVNDDTIQCTIVGPEFSNYVAYPEMMAVSEDYCPTPQKNK